MSAADAELAKMFKALGHPNRFRLFVEILEAGAALSGSSCWKASPQARAAIAAVLDLAAAQAAVARGGQAGVRRDGDE